MDADGETPRSPACSFVAPTFDAATSERAIAKKRIPSNGLEPVVVLPRATVWAKASEAGD